jgi:enoyl-CoA hydratase/carnithine racemase
VTALSGLTFEAGIPRLLRVSGYQLAAEMLLLGRNVTAVEARDRFRL